MWVVRVDDRDLDRPVEDRLRVAHEEAVQRVVGGDEHRQRLAAGPPGSAHLLPERRHRPRPTRQEHRVQAADIDAEFQRGRRCEAAQVTGAQLPLQDPPFFGQIPASVCRDHRSRPDGSVTIGARLALACASLVVIGSGPASIGSGPASIGRAAGGRLGKHLRSDPRSGEGHRLHARVHQIGQQIRSLGHGRAPPRGHPRFGIGHRPDRRLPQPDGHRRARRAVERDRADRHTDQASGVPTRVGDGRGGEDEGGVGAVAGCDPAQPPQDQREVRPENPSVDVAFVDDDIAQGAQERSPPLVPGQQRVVDEVGVGQHIGPVLADPPPFLGRCVAVIGRDAQPRQREPGHPVELVVGQSLGRREIQRSRAAPRGRQCSIKHVREHRNEVTQGLARGRPRGDDDMLAAMRGLSCLDLVAPQRGDALAEERSREGRGHPGRQVGRAGCSLGDPPGMPQPRLTIAARQARQQRRGVGAGRLGRVRSRLVRSGHCAHRRVPR
ncbi:MAG: hypothetical protein BWY91_02248 [bacterium ADurb.BinA028]|nr:MAG: hypothetical protein BWY91_02248 [bacterium ADurb.BinA028]